MLVRWWLWLCGCGCGRHSLFNSSFDTTSGFRTRAVLAVPVRSRAGRVLGVLQVLNKDPAIYAAAGHDGDPCFSVEDEALIRDVAGCVAMHPCLLNLARC